MKHFAMTIRKTFLFSLLSIFIFSSTSCTKRCKDGFYVSRTYVLGLDMHSLFLNDHVQLVVDGTVCFDQTVSTNLVIGYAGGTKLNVQGGKHSLQIFVNDKLKVSEQLSIDRNLYTGIQYDRSGEQISLLFSDAPFVYE